MNMFRDFTDFDELVFEDTASITASRFDSTKNLIVLTHGFTQSLLSQFPVVIKDG